MNFTRRERLLLLITSALNAWKDAHDKTKKLTDPTVTVINPHKMMLELHEDIDDIMFTLEVLAEEVLHMDEGEGDSTPRPSNN